MEAYALSFYDDGDLTISYFKSLHAAFLAMKLLKKEASKKYGIKFRRYSKEELEEVKKLHVFESQDEVREMNIEKIWIQP